MESKGSNQGRRLYGPCCESTMKLATLDPEFGSRGILYISDFLNTDNGWSNLREKWNFDITEISSKTYVDMALRNFNCPSVIQVNLTQMD